MLAYGSAEAMPFICVYSRTESSYMPTRCKQCGYVRYAKRDRRVQKGYRSPPSPLEPNSTHAKKRMPRCIRGSTQMRHGKTVSLNLARSLATDENDQEKNLSHLRSSAMAGQVKRKKKEREGWAASCASLVACGHQSPLRKALCMRADQPSQCRAF